jgi:hypothetical protein
MGCRRPASGSWDLWELSGTWGHVVLASELIGRVWRQKLQCFTANRFAGETVDGISSFHSQQQPPVAFQDFHRENELPDETFSVFVELSS